MLHGESIQKFKKIMTWFAEKVTFLHMCMSYRAINHTHSWLRCLQSIIISMSTSLFYHASLLRVVFDVGELSYQGGAKVNGRFREKKKDCFLGLLV